MSATIEYLGTRLAERARVPTIYQVYVIWLPDGTLLDAMTRLYAGHYACPECGTPWPMARDHGLIAKLVASPQAGSISDSCPSCPTILHFDRTAPADQLQLNWPRLFDAVPALMGDRPVRIGSRFVRAT